MLDINFYICSAFAFFAWIVIIIKFIIVQRNIKWLQIEDKNEKFNSKISVIIPARDEEDDISDSLLSVLSQKEVNLEVIVIDDHSTDKTGKIIDQVADNYANIKVIHNPSLNPGWLGKCNAMNYGLSKATGQYIIFTDADVIHKPGCFISAITEFEKNRYDFLSLFPSPVIKPFWENVIIPMYISGISQLISTTGIEDPDTDDAVGTGAFMLVKKEALENIGGLDSIKGEMADDLALAKKIKRCGYKIGYRFAPDCMKVRLFKTKRDVFRNTVKNVLLIVDKHHWLAIPVIILSAVIFWLPLYTILSGVVQGNYFHVTAGVSLYLFQYMSLYSGKRIFKFSAFKSLFFPLVVIVFTYSILKALYYDIRGEIFWRGRRIQVKGKNT